MNYNRKTFRFLKLEKSGDFARRKNEVEDKMLDTKLRVMEKEERSVRQKLFEIRREKYSRSFYTTSPERGRSSKFVDVNVCETDEGLLHENLISASGVERTKTCLRRKASVIEELCPGQVVRVCVSSKLEDKVTGDENVPSGSFSPIGKAKKRRHSVAIVTDIGRQNAADVFASVQSYMQSISENGVTQVSQDDLYICCKEQQRNSDVKGYTLQDKYTADQDNGASSKKLSKSTSPEALTKPEDPSSCEKRQQDPVKNLSISDNSRVKFVQPGTAEKSDIDQNKTPSPRPKRKAYSVSPLRPRSSRSYSDSCVELKSAYSRKCSTPVPMLSRRHSRMGFVEPNAPRAFRHETESNPKMLRLGALGVKRRPRSLTVATPGQQQDYALTVKEEKMAEQVLIRQIEIQNAADKMRKLSFQHFGDSKSTQKIRRQSTSSSSSPCMRRGLENSSNDSNNNSEAQRPGIVRRHTDNPQELRKFVNNQCKKQKGQMGQVLSGLSNDIADCRYLRCDQVQLCSIHM